MHWITTLLVVPILIMAVGLWVVCTADEGGGERAPRPAIEVEEMS